MVPHVLENTKQANCRKYVKRQKAKKIYGQKIDTALEHSYEHTVERIRKGRSTKKCVDEDVRFLKKIKKQRKKRQQYSAQSYMPDFKDLGTPLLDSLKAMIEYVKTIREQVGESILKALIDLFTTLYNIWKNPTWDSFLVNISSFVYRLVPSHYAELVIEWLKSTFTQFSAQSGGGEEPLWKKLFTSFTDLRDDALWGSIKEFFMKTALIYASVSDLVAFESLDLTTIMEKFTKFSSTLDVSFDVFETMYHVYEWVLGCWDAIQGKAPWPDTLLGREEAKTFEVEVRLLEQAFPLVIKRCDVELKDKYNLTITQFESRLNKAVKKAKQLIERCSSAQQRMAVSNFSRSLMAMQSQVFALLADAPVREEAYAVKLSGPSSCGKSTMVSMLTQTLLNAYGEDPTIPGQVVATNLSERYESTIMPSHKVIFADDVANNKNEKPNYDRLLNYINTVPRPLEKADVKEKGILYPGNVAFCCTTNDETVRAFEASVCPESILRRFTLDVQVEIREQYRNEYGGLVKQDGMNLSVYKLTLRRFQKVEADNKLVVWDVIPREEWNEFDDEENDLLALMKFVVKDVARHRQVQRKILSTQQKLMSGEFCSACRVPAVLCSCEDECEAQMGGALAMLRTAQLWDLRDSLRDVRTLAHNSAARTLFYQRVFSKRAEIQKLLLGFIGSLLLLPLLNQNLARIGCVIWLIRAHAYYNSLVKEVDDAIASRTDQLSSLCTSVQEHITNNMKKYFALGGTLSAMFVFYKLWKSSKIGAQEMNAKIDSHLRIVTPSLGGKPEAQDERDYKEGYTRLPPQVGEKGKTTNGSDLQEHVGRVLRLVTVTNDKSETFSVVNGLFVGGNVLMLPAHSIPDGQFDIETTASPGLASARTKDTGLNENYCVFDRSRDVVFVLLPSAPPARDMSVFFPMKETTFYGMATCLVWKDPEGKIIRSRQPIRPLSEDVFYFQEKTEPGYLYGTRRSSTSVTLPKENGYKAELEIKTFSGLCGAPYVDLERGIIYGFHVAGVAGRNNAILNRIDRPTIMRAIDELKTKGNTLVANVASDVRVDAYGQSFSIKDGEPLFMREDGLKEKATVTYIGKVVNSAGEELQSRARPPYMKTPFQGVVETFGEKTHKPPTKVNSVEKTMKTLNKLTDPVQSYNMTLLDRAIGDYAERTSKVIENNLDYCRDTLRLYTQQEALDGTQDGKMGGLPNSTSCGFPLMKSKKAIFVKDSDDESQVQCPRQLNGEFHVQEEIDMIGDAWKRGERSEAIFKASSKTNELLPLAKAEDKVRKFYGSSIGYLVNARRALGGIPIFMRKFWKETECLVGIDPTSKEWRDFQEYLSQYGEERMIAGDFSGFDTRMAAQITTAASKIILGWYEKVGADEETLAYVKGALSDICHPNVLIDSDLYRFANMNPSGNPITVQFNSVCNSLMMRYVYYAMMPTIKEPFGQNVALGTFGDDNAMSVKRCCKWFTHTTCQSEFAKLGIGYTMAQKDAVSRPYINLKEVSFLKRRFEFHPDLNSIVAPIEEDSVYKKFYYVKKKTETPLSPEAQYAAYVDSSLREVALWGREAYKKFLAQIQGIMDLNPSLKYHIYLIPYDEMIKILMPKYSDSYVNDNRKLFSQEFLADDLTDDEIMNDVCAQLVDLECQAKKTGNNVLAKTLGLMVAATTSTLLTAYFVTWALDGGLSEFIDKCRSKLEMKRAQWKDTAEMGFSLNGLAEVAEELGVPEFLVQWFYSSE